MKIAVISDLHLGAGGYVDQFQHNEMEFLKFLNFLESNFEKIILLGDIYETLMPLQFGDTKEALASCLSAHKAIVERFQKPQYIYVHGNHDWIAQQHLKAPEEYRLIVDGQHILFRHGHQYDSLIRTSRFISEFGIWIGGWLLRIGLWPIYKVISKLDENSSATKVLTKLEQLAIESAPKADIIVTGHTHISKRAEYNSKLYLNSGTCSGGRFSYLALDTRTGTYTSHTSW